MSGLKAEESSRVAAQGLGEIVDVWIRPLCFCIYSFPFQTAGAGWANCHQGMLNSFRTTIGIECIISVKLEYDNHDAMQN